MTWALWLAVPVGATALAALASWWRGWLARRAARPLSTQEAIRRHGDYLDALVIPARSAARPAPGSGHGGGKAADSVADSTADSAADTAEAV